MDIRQLEYALSTGRKVWHYEERVPLSIGRDADGSIFVADVYDLPNLGGKQPSRFKPGSLIHLSSFDLVPRVGDWVLVNAAEFTVWYREHQKSQRKRRIYDVSNSFDWGAVREVLSIGSSVGSLVKTRPFMMASLRCFSYFGTPGEFELRLE